MPRTQRYPHGFRVELLKVTNKCMLDLELSPHLSQHLLEAIADIVACGSSRLRCRAAVLIVVVAEPTACNWQNRGAEIRSFSCPLAGSRVGLTLHGLLHHSRVDGRREARLNTTQLPRKVSALLLARLVLQFVLVGAHLFFFDPLPEIADFLVELTILILQIYAELPILDGQGLSSLQLSPESGSDIIITVDNTGCGAQDLPQVRALSLRTQARIGDLGRSVCPRKNSAKSSRGASLWSRGHTWESGHRQRRYHHSETGVRISDCKRLRVVWLQPSTSRLIGESRQLTPNGLHVAIPCGHQSSGAVLSLECERILLIH